MQIRNFLACIDVVAEGTMFTGNAIICMQTSYCYLSWCHKMQDIEQETIRMMATDRENKFKSWIVLFMYFAQLVVLNAGLS